MPAVRMIFHRPRVGQRRIVGTVGTPSNPTPLVWVITPPEPVPPPADPDVDDGQEFLPDVTGRGHRDDDEEAGDG